jgi:hypothetical protein
MANTSGSKNLPSIDISHNLLGRGLAMLIVEILADPRYEVILESTLDDLM